MRKSKQEIKVKISKKYGNHETPPFHSNKRMRNEEQTMAKQMSQRKTYKMTCAPSEDLDQPGHPLSLIGLRCLHEESLVLWLPIGRTTKTLIRLGGCAGRSFAGRTCHFVDFVMCWLKCQI